LALCACADLEMAAALRWLQQNRLIAALGAAGGLTAASATSWLQTGHASDALEPAEYPWNHIQPWQGYDHASIRRGFQVYKQVCSTCHSLERIAYRHLVDVAYTEKEMKAIAAEATVQDGPDAEGEMFERTGKLFDYMPKPYPNEQAARYSNNGALPPDLSLVVKAREKHEDYIFALLTGYRDAPAGINIRGGLHYNPYFPGGAIAMTQPLSDDQIEYDDGTEATVSQMSKDVTTFLSWASEPKMEERKRVGIKFYLFLLSIGIPLMYYKNFKWSVIKNRVISFKK